jgi:aryl-alcohol dehydrogenase-like predicted oxidoreductase
MTEEDFLHTNLGRTGIKVHRLGLAATYRPGRSVIGKALDAGLNYLFFYGFDTHMTGFLRREIQVNRDRFVLATGAYNYIWWHSNLRKALEKRLRKLKTDYLDVFLFLGVMREREFPDHLLDEMIRFREEGKIRACGISTHNRKFAGKLASQGDLDILMIRYNAAHRGADEDIFPNLAEHNPGLVSYTATRWRYLLKRPKGCGREERIPTAGECYRFVLSNPNVDVCLTAPSNEGHFDENLKAIQSGPLSDEEMSFMREFGDRVRHTKRWFM